MTGFIHSVQSLGTVDGPGVRAVIFASGCPLRCVFCHNPDTWDMAGGQELTEDELCEKIIRLYPYIKDGGVTFSGGEPCMQAEFFCSISKKLKDAGLHIALDTSGCILNEKVKALLELVDLVLLDIKFNSEDGYKKGCGGSLGVTLNFLDFCHKSNIPVWIRQVVIPEINDTEADVLKLISLIEPYREIIKKVELLPFKKLCLEKYEAVGIPFPLANTPELPATKLEKLQIIANN